MVRGFLTNRKHTRRGAVSRRRNLPRPQLCLAGEALTKLWRSRLDRELLRPFDPLTTACRAALREPKATERPLKGGDGPRPQGVAMGVRPGARDEISLCSVNPYSFKVSSGRPLKGGEGQPRAGEGVPTNRNHPQCCFASARHLPRPRPPVFWARADGPPPAGTAHFFFRTKKFSRKPVLCRFLPHASQSA